MALSTPIYREVQHYRELPPFTLLVVVAALFGWFLLVWVGVLARPLGALQIPTWFAWIIGLSFGVALPLAYPRVRMTTEVFADRVMISNGMSGRLAIPLGEIVEVEIRTDDINDDYNTRNIGEISMTRTAYTVTSSNGVQLMLVDGRQILVGSKEPQALSDAILSVWQTKNRAKDVPEVNMA